MGTGAASGRVLQVFIGMICSYKRVIYCRSIHGAYVQYVPWKGARVVVRGELERVVAVVPLRPSEPLDSS